MKEASSLRQPYATSRDLGVVMEESEGSVAMSQSNMNYINQVLDPSLPSSLSFLRSVHTKNHSTSTSPYHHPDLNSNHALENGRTSLPMRRARAGTMPSMIHIPEDRVHHSPIMRPTAAAAAAAVSDTRHRSGSLNLPAPPPMQLPFDSSIFGTSWANMERDNSQSQVRSSLPSPSTEQLLRGDSDFSIARTLRSLGLEDERATSMADTVSNGGGASTVYHHQHHEHPTPDMHIPTTRSLLSNNRSRSYSVNAAVRYQEPPISSAAAALHSSRSRASSVSRSFANPLENLSVHQNRPRAASMGRMDYARSTNLPIPSSLWQMQRVPLETLSDEDSEYQSQTYAESTQSLQNEPSLSLGDSELLANMLQKQTYADGLKVTAETQDHPMRYMNNGTLPEPYVHYSQSTPTFRNHQAQMTPSTSSPTQAATRSLWIGNIDATVTVENLTQMFSAFGPIESVRLLLEKECAFVNFFQTEDAVRAKEEVLGRLGGRVGNCIVRIGFGRADAAMPDTTVLQPTRALWLGNIPPGTAPSTLQHLFSSFGTIESVRVLSHKNCGFVNFDSVESASRARDALLQNEIGVPGFGGVRVGFAKVPPAKALATDGNNCKLHSSNDRAANTDNESWLVDLWKCMQEFGAQDEAMSQVKALETPSSYFESIPPVPELGANRKFDAAKLRELRKKLDGATRGTREVEMIAFDCMDEIAGLSSDYIGNTVVQRLFEKCTEDTKTAMLERIAPHLAAIGVHKNGTWAAQKIIDTIKTPAQVNLVCTHLKPYVPPLLLDQFGNYAVQCCLRLGDGNNQFIFDAMVERLLNIAQGRFGARAMRGILENQHVTANQQIFVAAALAQNVVSLAVNANGSLLLSWLLDSSNFEDRFSIVASRLAPHLSQVATHKLGSQMVLKIINQTHDNQAQATMLDGLMEQSTLSAILADQDMAAKIRPLVIQSDSAGHKKLLDELSNISNGGNDRNEQ